MSPPPRDPGKTPPFRRRPPKAGKRRGVPELKADERPAAAPAAASARAKSQPATPTAADQPSGERREPTLRAQPKPPPAPRFGLFAGARAGRAAKPAPPPVPKLQAVSKSSPAPAAGAQRLRLNAREDSRGTGKGGKGGGGRGGGSRPGGGRGSWKAPRWLRRATSIIVVAAVWGLVVLAAFLAYYAYDLPDLDRLNLVERQPSVTLIGDDGSTLATFGDLYGQFVPVKEMAPALPEAVVATEDRRFYHHFGVDPLGMLRAALVDARAGRLVEGGSTITQQLAKNVFLTPARTVKRKVQEILLALLLEHRLSKDQILSLYLNRVYLGAGTWGVDAASHRYFDKSARDLTLPEAAMLAGLLKAPSHFAPTSDLVAARERASVVLDRMVDAGFITQAAAADAKAHPATPVRQQAPLRDARYYTDWVLQHVDDYIGHRWQDIIVTTTIDPKLQQDAEDAVAVVMQTAAKRDASQAALVVLGQDGAVKAMVGGRNYAQSPFNRATQARRQPGSSFKLFDYLTGLEAGLTPDSQFFDGPISVGNWQPKDFERRYLGNVSLRQAFALSLNTVAVEVTQKVGIRKVIAMAHRLGISEDLPDVPSLALGSCDLSLIELTGAYDAVANGGHGIIPYGIAQIRTPDGQTLYQRQGGGLGQVLQPAIVREMTDLLTAVVQTGTGRAAALDRPAAGKTGTSQDFRDAWFLGFTAELTAGAWVGNDNDTPMKRVVGGSLPADIWKHFMTAALSGTPPKPLLENLSQPAAAPNAPAPAPATPKTLWDKIVQEFGGKTPSPAPARSPGPRYSHAPEVIPAQPAPSNTDPAPGRSPFSPGQ